MSTAKSGTAKVMALDMLVERVSELRRQGKSIAHCHGCFDMLHAGHLRHFEKASVLADVLVVTVTPDRFVNKGPNRPVYPEDARAELIAGLEVVDLVAVNRWASAVPTIGLVGADIFVKGSEYETRAREVNPNFLAEAKAVEAAGGRVAYTNGSTMSSTVAFKRRAEQDDVRTAQEPVHLVVASGSLAYRAVIFDLDGVVTDTARLHAQAWKALFDVYLRRRSGRTGELFQPFHEVIDYRLYVDGKSRYDGARSFLASRDIALDDGDPDTSEYEETICALSNRKDRLFAALLAQDGVRVFKGAVTLARNLGALGVGVALATSSKNSLLVLERANLTNLFSVRIDGVIATELGLQGKPAPDIFLACAQRLQVNPVECAVVEDSVAGVAAARAGGFGLVIGIAPADEEPTLFTHGADVVVSDLDSTSPTDVDVWYRQRQDIGASAGATPC